MLYGARRRVPGVTRSSTNVIDEESGLLYEHIHTNFACDISGYESRMGQGVHGHGYVPSDRVSSLEELHWTEQELPEVDWKQVDRTKRK